MTMAAPARAIGVALSDAAVLDLLTAGPAAAYAALRDVTDVTPGVLYLGGDRFRPRPAGAQYLDPLVAAQTLLGRLPGAAALVTTSPDVEHPYNFARRIATLDHFSGGRIGAVVGTRDHRADRVDPGATPWTGRPTGPALTADFLTVLRKLWNSWPRESIIVDKERGHFADSSLIVRIEHEGLYSVAGPLGTSSSVQGEPPLGAHLTLGRHEADSLADAEFFVSESGQGFALGHPAARAGAVDDGTVFLPRVESLADLPALVRELAARADLAADTGSRSATLRERLGLAPRRLDISGLPRAFAPTT